MYISRNMVGWLGTFQTGTHSPQIYQIVILRGRYLKYFLVSPIRSPQKILFLFFASLQTLDLRNYCTGLIMNTNGGCRVRVEKSCVSWAGTIHIPTSLSRPGNPGGLGVHRPVIGQLTQRQWLPPFFLS
jgi:hypothetical protein